MIYTIIIIAILLYVITIVGWGFLNYYEGKDEWFYKTIGDVVEDMSTVCFIPLINTITFIIMLIVYAILSIWYLIWIKTPLHKWWDKLMNIKLK